MNTWYEHNLHNYPKGKKYGPYTIEWVEDKARTILIDHLGKAKHTHPSEIGGLFNAIVNAILTAYSDGEYTGKTKAPAKYLKPYEDVPATPWGKPYQMVWKESYEEQTAYAKAMEKQRRLMQEYILGNLERPEATYPPEECY